MSSITRDFFVDSVSTSAVQLRRVPGLTPIPTASPGEQLHQVNLVTGVNAAFNADTGFWVANCTRYRVTIERLT